MDLFDPKYFLFFAILAAVWTIPWKGVALWKAAKNGNRVWFVMLLLLNTLAILEMVYIFIVSKRERGNKNNM